MKWYIALLFNVMSSLGAILGFFVGVAIGTRSTETNNWILAIAAGVFLYIALVDLVRREGGEEGGEEGGRRGSKEREGGEEGGRRGRRGGRKEREGGEEGGRRRGRESVHVYIPHTHTPVEKYFSAGEKSGYEAYSPSIYHDSRTHAHTHTHTHTHTQLPELIHSREKGRTRWILFLMANIGFYISFVVLLLIAIYEEELNTLIK